MIPGDCIRWYTDRGWRYGRVIAVGYKWVHVERMGKAMRVERDKALLHPGKGESK